MGKIINGLIFDTSKPALKIGVCFGKSKEIYSSNDNFNHLETLIPEIDKLLLKSNKQKTDIEYVGVCTGPGSFTGIRVGITTASALSFAGKINLFGFTAFDVYKYLFVISQSIDADVMIPVIDAKKKRFYCSFLTKDSLEYDMFDLSPEEIKNMISIRFKNKKIVFAGNDAKLLKSRDNFFDSFDSIIHTDYTADDLVNYLEYHVNNKSMNDPTPVYLRKSEAEIALLKKQEQ